MTEIIPSVSIKSIHVHNDRSQCHVQYRVVPVGSPYNENQQTNKHRSNSIKVPIYPTYDLCRRKIQEVRDKCRKLAGM